MRRKSRQFTPVEDEWLKSHHSSGKTIRSLTEEFNEAFRESPRSSDVIKAHCRLALGLKQDNRLFSTEERDWLKNNAPRLSRKKATELFNETFSANRTEGVVKAVVNRHLGLGFLNDKTQNSTMPIGEETIRNGYVYVKTCSDHHGGNGAYKNWKPKHHIEWERYNGAIPKGKQIIFLDRNHGNWHIDNLYALDGRLVREMVKKQWFFQNPICTLAAIKWCELFYAIKDTERGITNYAD